MVWKEIGMLVDSHEKGKDIFYLHFIMIIDIIFFIYGLIFKNKIVIIITIILYTLILLIFFILQRKNIDRKNRGKSHSNQKA